MTKYEQHQTREALKFLTPAQRINREIEARIAESTARYERTALHQAEMEAARARFRAKAIAERQSTSR